MPHEDYECLENEWSWLCSVQVVHRDPCATRVLLFKLKWRTEINSSCESFATFLQVRESHTALQRALLRKTYHILDKRATSLAWNEIQEWNLVLFRLAMKLGHALRKNAQPNGEHYNLGSRHVLNRAWQKLSLVTNKDISFLLHALRFLEKRDLVSQCKCKHGFRWCVTII